MTVIPLILAASSLGAKVQTEDAFLLAVMADSRGTLSTLSVTIQGSSQKLSLLPDVGWHRLTTGQWLWVKQKGDTIRFGAKDVPPGEFKPALNLGVKSWQTSWIEGGFLSLGLYGADSQPPSAVWTFSRTQDQATLTERAKLKLGEAWTALPPREQEKWKAPAYDKESFGSYRREGSFYAGMHLSPLGENDPPAQGQSSQNRTYLLTAEVGKLSTQAWRSAKSTGGIVLDAVGSDKTAWGLVLSEEAVKLTSFSGDRFGRAERQQAFAGVRFVAFQSWSGIEAKKVSEELKRQKA